MQSAFHQVKNVIAFNALILAEELVQEIRSVEIEPRTDTFC